MADQMDEGLYSRQLYVLGKEAMLKMQNSSVLVIGLRGLGMEIAKNIALAGVKQLALYDPAPVTVNDLSTQFFLTAGDVGSGVLRADASAPRLAELNLYVPITVEQSLDELVLSRYQVVVATDVSLEQQVQINNFTHANGIKFIACDIRGLFGSAFIDMGPDFTVLDPNDAEPKAGIVSDIETDGTVTMLDDNRHGLELGDFVKFSEVEGLPHLNSGTPFEIENLGPYAFKLKAFDAQGGAYVKGGLYTQVKMPTKIQFELLHAQLSNPELLISDFAKFDRPSQLHIGFQALHAFATRHQGQLPRAVNSEDAAEVVQLAKEIATAHPKVLGESEVDAKVITELLYQARGDLPGMVAFYGGLVAQEALKACLGKFTPIKQWLYFDLLELLPDAKQFPRTPETCAPVGSRYDAQIAVFGSAFQERVANLRVFLVGSGAIGCEMLKNWAMMGLGSGPQGKIVLTDNDLIEKSNLNRQFLFRPKDVGKNKSEVAAAAVLVMNPELHGKIHPLVDKVGPDTEHIFDDNFWELLDLVTNALDNVEARTYVDRRCVFFEKPLLELGTLGTQGNTQVVIPNVTESYSLLQDPPEVLIPLCTLRLFPNKIDHTIAWAKLLFQGYFADAPANVNLFLSQPDYVELTLKLSGDVKGTLETVAQYLNKRPYTFEDCIKWARLEFQAKYHNDILQLLYNFPKDAKTQQGGDFWSGPKRAPDPLQFDVNNPNHLHFVVAGANLMAYVYGLKGNSTDLEVFRKTLAELEPTIPAFKPRDGVKIQANDNEPDPNAQKGGVDEEDEIAALALLLPAPATLAGYRLTPVEFEKDDDTNHHIEFINAALNCRALNYAIETVDEQRTKFIAGRIIPAIATTTALVTGLVNLELYKVAAGQDDIEAYKNGFVNLALPFVGFLEPMALQKGEYNKKQFDKVWLRFTLHGDITLQQFVDHFQEKEGLEITMVSYNVMLLYAIFHPLKKQQERLPMKLTDLIASVGNKPIDPHVKNLIFDVCVDDAEGEDAEVPYVVVKL